MSVLGFIIMLDMIALAATLVVATTLITLLLLPEWAERKLPASFLSQLETWRKDIVEPPEKRKARERAERFAKLHGSDSS